MLNNSIQSECQTIKDKRIDELDIKSARKKYSKDFLRLSNSKIALRLVESSGMKPHKGFVKIANYNQF